MPATIPAIPLTVSQYLSGSAEGSFGWLIDDLVEMSGAHDRSQVSPQELGLAKAAINQAYRECYWERDGQFPAWASRLKGILFKVPSTAPATFTLGQKAFVDNGALRLNQTDSGAIVTIGNCHYTFDGLNASGAPCLIEPFDQATGVYDPMVYFRSAMLDECITKMKNMPEVINGFLLAPFAGRGDEALMRSLFVRDFYSLDPEPVYFSTNNWSTEFYLLGEPRSFWIETLVGIDNCVRHRMCVWPLPDGQRNRTVRFETNVLPAFLQADTDVPAMPAGTSRDILLPMARAIYATRTRRFNGDAKAIQDEGVAARFRLAALFPQQKTPLRFRVCDDHSSSNW